MRSGGGTRGLLPQARMGGEQRGAPCCVSLPRETGVAVAVFPGTGGASGARRQCSVLTARPGGARAEVGA